MVVREWNSSVMGTSVYPNGLAVHPGSGDLFVADLSGQRVVRLSLSDFDVRLVCNASLPVKSFHRHVAFDCAGTSLFVANGATAQIVQLDVDTGALLAVFNTTSPTLNNPWGVATDCANRLFVADTYNHRALRINIATGLVDRAWNTSSPALRYPSGIAVDAAGAVYLADRDNDRVVMMDGDSNTLLTVYNTFGPAMYGPWTLRLSALGNA